MPFLNEFSRYDEGVAQQAFSLEKLRIQGFPHLLGIAPEIREQIFRYLLDIDNCRHKSDNEDWIENYQHTGHEVGAGSDYPPPWKALRSWLFSDTSPSAHVNSSIKGFNPWRVEIDFHPAVLKASKLLLVEGMNFIANENIFVKICTDIPDYDVHLQWFGLPVFTYRKRSYEDRCKYESIMKTKQSGVGFQSFRTMIEIDMRTDQTKLLSQLKHFYLVPFKAIDQIFRALYLTEGREQAWFRFVINRKHVPQHMRPNISFQIIHWLCDFRSVGSISVIIPEEGLCSHPVTEELTSPFNAWDLVSAVARITGLKHTTKFPIYPPHPTPFTPKDRNKPLTQLSQLSALLTHNHPILRSLPPSATWLLATLVSAPLYTLLRLEYNITAKSQPSRNSSWRQILHLSLLALSLPSAFHLQRLQTLHIHLHALTVMGHEKQATKLMSELLVQLRLHIHIQYELGNNNNQGGGGIQDIGVGHGLSKRTRALVNIARYGLENGFVPQEEGEGGWGSVFLMGVWEGLVRDGWAVQDEGMNHGKELAGGGKGLDLEEIWKVKWPRREGFE